MNNGCSVEVGVAYLHGRIEHEIEVYATHILGCTAKELASRIGGLLIGLASQPEQHVEAMRPVRSGAAKLGRPARPVAMDVRPRTDGMRRQHRKGKKDKVKSAGSWWWSRTATERKAIIAKRVTATRQAREKAAA